MQNLIPFQLILRTPRPNCLELIGFGVQRGLVQLKLSTTGVATITLTYKQVCEERADITRVSACSIKIAGNTNTKTQYYGT